MIKDIKWHESLRALFGTNFKDQRDVDVWEFYLSDVNTCNSETIKAIKYASESAMTTDRYHATVTDLIKWIKMFRAREIRERETCDESRSADQIKAEFIARWKDDDDFEMMTDEAWCLPNLCDDEITALIDEVVNGDECDNKR